MMGKGDGNDESGTGDSKSSFADLLGEETRPLRRGPARLGPAGPANPARPGKRNREKAGPATFRWPDAEDRLRAAGAGVSDAQLLGLSRGDPEPDERIDLHGTRRDAAATLVAKRIESAVAQGHRCVLIIHGRGQRSATGEAVLRDALPDWLTRGPTAKRVLAFAPAPDRLGGLGATLILLQRPR